MSYIWLISNLIDMKNTSQFLFKSAFLIVLVSIFKPGYSQCNFKFDIKATPDSIVCYDDRQIFFSQTPIPNSYRQVWTFGDPYSYYNKIQGENVWKTVYDFTGQNPSTGLLLQGAVYDINLKVWTPGCVKDTTYKKMVKIQGPAAFIDPYPSILPLNNSIDAEDKPVNRSYFENLNRYACNPISAIDPNTGEPLDTIWYYDKFNKVNKTKFKRLIYCNGKVVDTFRIKDTLEPGTRKYWIPGDPIPIGKNGIVYLEGNGNSSNPLWMHDTDIYDPDCSAPNWVKFTNNSVKSRFSVNGNPISAADNIPPGIDPSYFNGKWDKCDNPSLPWGSDSLIYLWDFSSDPLTTNCTTYTAAGSRMYDSANCQFSRARTPWHRFDSSGCWQIFLKAMDPVTGCESQQTITILMTEPDAGWEKDFFYDSITISLPFYAGADSFLMDSLLLTKDPYKPLFSRILSRGRAIVDGSPVDTSKWYITNRKTAFFHWKKGNTPSFGSSVFVRLLAKRPLIINDINDTVWTLMI